MKTLYILAKPDIGEFLKKELLVYFPKIYINPNKNELNTIPDESLIIDFINYTINDTKELLSHNTIYLKEVLEAATKSNSRILLAYNIKDKTSPNSLVAFAKSIINEHSKINNVSSHFIELPDVFGPKINTTSILMAHSENIRTSSTLKVNNDNALFYAVFEEDFYEGILNFIINELNSPPKGTRTYSLVPNAPITEIELAHFIKDLINDHVYIRYKEVFDNLSVPDIQIDPNAIIWTDKITLEEALKATLLSFDIALRMGPNYRATCLPAAPDIVISPKHEPHVAIPMAPTDTISEAGSINFEDRKQVSKLHIEELQTIEDRKNAKNSKINLEEVERIKKRLQEVRTREEAEAIENIAKEVQKKDLSKTKTKNKPTRFKNKSLVFVFGLFFSFTAILFSTFVFFYYFFFGSLALNKSIDHLNHQSYKEAYENSDRAYNYFTDLQPSFLVRAFVSTVSKKTVESVFPLVFLQKNAASVKNISIIKQNLHDLAIINNQKVLGATSDETLKAYIDQAIELLDSLSHDKESLNQKVYFYDEIYRYPISKLEENKTYLSKLKNMTNIIEDVSGYKRPLKFLLVIQDDREIKPTGGRITFTAELEIKAGKLRIDNFKEAFELDKIIIDKDIKFIPPLPIRKSFNTDRLLISQANFSPDFQEAGANIINIYKTIYDIHVDGILSTTYSFFNNINEDFFIPAEAFKTKEVAKDTVYKMVDRFNKESFPANILLTELENRDIQVFIDDGSINASFVKNNWGGALNTSDDFVYVVDTNMDQNKINRDILKHIYISTTKKDNALLRNLIVTYTNTNKNVSKELSVDNTFTNHLRVLLPDNIKLISADLKTDGITSSILRNIEIYPYQNKTVLAFDTSVKSGELVQLSFLYGSKLNKDMKTSKIYIQKQPGSRSFFTAFINKKNLNPNYKFPSGYIKTEYNTRVGLTKSLDEDLKVEIPL